jgi:hypothetical protein
VAVAVLSKETMLLALPAVMVALWQSTRRTAVRPWAFGGFVSGLVLGVFYPLYALLKGELWPGSDHVSLIGAWQFQLQHRSGSGNVFVAGSNANLLLGSWLYYDTVLLVGGLAATVLALLVPRLRPPAIAAALMVLVAARPGGYLPAMYIVQVLPFFAIVLVGVVELGVTRILGRSTSGAAPHIPPPRRPAHRAAEEQPRPVPPPRRPALGWLRWSLVAVLAVGAGAYVLPRWYVGDHRALVTQDNAGYRDAAGFLRSAMADRAHATMVVDDVLWLDLVNGGYERDRVIWFYKLDLDPAVAARLKRGWRDVDYVVSSPQMRQDAGILPTVTTLLAHSVVERTFGSGGGRIEIRRVVKEAQ